MSVLLKQKILPVAYPVITSYPHYASLLSLLPDDDSVKSWLANQYVNLRGIILEDEVSYEMRFSPLCMIRACPLVNYSQLQKDILYLYGSIVDFMIESMNLGYYFFISYDEFNIHHSDSYSKRHIKHQMFVYGYDSIEEVFYIGEFFNGNCYEFKLVDFKELEEAIRNEDKISNSVVNYFDIMKYNGYQYKFDKNMLVKDLKNYLDSTVLLLPYEINLLSSVEADDIRNHKYSFGVRNYELMIQWLSKVLDYNVLLTDIRPFHVMYDHKTMMIQRIDYLHRNNIIQQNDDFMEGFKEVQSLCLINRNLFLKFRANSNKVLVEKMIDNINKIREKEVMLVKKLLEYLNK